MDPTNKLMLVDAYALIFRAHYAFIRNPMFNSRGLNTSVILGFLNTLEDILRLERPSHVAVGFDLPEPTFRHIRFPQYKAQRKETPPEIIAAVPYIYALLKAFRIPAVSYPGFEADDVIGTMARQGEEAGMEVVMVTPDKDYGQLVTSRSRILKPGRGKGDPEVVDPAVIRTEYGIDDPTRVIDILALWGDAADNIPGAPGIGEKTAIKLISDYGSLEGLYNHLDSLKGKQRESLEQNREKVFLARELITIDRFVPIAFKEAELVYQGPDPVQLKALYEELEFRSHLRKLQSAPEATVSPEEGKGSAPMLTTTPPGTHVQGDLFASQAVSFSPSGPALKTIRDVPHQYHLTETPTEIQELANLLLRQAEVCFDTETTGVDANQCELVGMSFCFQPFEAWYVPLPSDRKETRAILEVFRPFFENPAIQKIGQNIKYDILVLKWYGIETEGRLFDTMIAHYLLNPEEKHNMDFLAAKYLGYEPIHIDSLIGKKGKNQGTMRDVAPRQVCDYAAEDADVTLQLKLLFAQELDRNGLSELAYSIEMPLIPVLALIEKTGVRIDPRLLEVFGQEITATLLETQQAIYDTVGYNFNVSSPKQLGEILFDRLRIVENPRRTATRQYATDEEELTRLMDRHPVIPLILTYRGIRKLLSTYVETLPRLINPRSGRIHTTFIQTVASTGRLSSQNPNLQNIPIREELGQRVRMAFVCQDGDYRFLSADYSQIELRLMAHLSGDAALIEAFSKNEDIHAATAARIFKVPPGEVTREMRGRAKTANFGIIYGISSFGLAQRLNISRTEGKQLIDGYFESYPGVREFMDRCIRQARHKGYVETLFGRRRQLPDILSRNQAARSFAERNAINAPIQGTAADILKLAMIRIHDAFRRFRFQSRMVLTVHDELDFEVFVPEMEQVTEIIRREMEQAVALSVPLVVEVGTGNNWLEAH